jgi:hypothetical protein
VTAFYRARHRTRLAANAIAELAVLPRDLTFVDDNLSADREWASELFRAMIALDKRWVSQASLAIDDLPELLELTRRAGFLGLFIGVGTLSEANLRAVDNTFNGPDG